jgi:hypothetical protein
LYKFSKNLRATLKVQAMVTWRPKLMHPWSKFRYSVTTTTTTTTTTAAAVAAAITTNWT